MSGTQKTIPSDSHERKSITDTGQMPMPYDQNRALKCVQSNEASSASDTKDNSGGSDTPTDENLIDDDIIEENSHVMPPTRQSASVQRGRAGQAAQ